MGVWGSDESGLGLVCDGAVSENVERHTMGKGALTQVKSVPFEAKAISIKGLSHSV